MRRFVIICLGLLFLLTACSNASTGQPTATDHVANSQANTNLARAKTDGQASSVGLPHATPTHSKVVTVSSSAVSSASVGSSTSAGSSVSTDSATANGQKGTLTLALACSGLHAQDGFNVSNAQARACVYTSPGAHLNIKVSFCGNKPDTSSALQGTFIANASGFYEWDWKPQASCLSSWSATVTAQLNGQSAAVSEASSAQSTSQSTSQSSAHSSSQSSSSVNVPDGW